MGEDRDSWRLWHRCAHPCSVALSPCADPCCDVFDKIRPDRNDTVFFQLKFKEFASCSNEYHLLYFYRQVIFKMVVLKVHIASATLSPWWSTLFMLIIMHCILPLSMQKNGCYRKGEEEWGQGTFMDNSPLYIEGIGDGTQTDSAHGKAYHNLHQLLQSCSSISHVAKNPLKIVVVNRILGLVPVRHHSHTICWHPSSSL